MHKALTLLRKAAFSVSIAGAVAFSSTAPATTLGLSDTPLFLASGAEPNLIMAIDDSGSMDNEVLFPTNDGAAWWRAGTSGQCDGTNDNSFVGCRNNATGSSDVREAGKLNFNNTGDASGTWKKYVYLFPNGQNGNTDSARRRSGDSTNDHFAIPPIPSFAWARSPNHNKAYFNPKVTYRPWASNEDFTFGNASYTAARFDPVFESTLTMSLISDRAGTGATSAATCGEIPAGQTADNYYFKVYTGMTLPIGTCIRRQAGTVWEEVRTNPCQIGVNNGCRTTGNTNTFRIDTGSRVAIRYYPATFFIAAAATDLPANFGYTGTTISGLAPDGTALTGYQIISTNFASTAQYTAAIQNFANWFTYYRKRHQALRAGLGQSFANVTGVRVDGFTINNRGAVTMGSINDATKRRDLYNKFYTQWVGNGGTPNRSAVARMITEYQRTGANAPITASCQKNFGMLFTDGFSNSPANGDGINTVYGDEDAGAPDPYRDGTTGVAGTLADATFKAYTTTLRSDLTQGRVIAPEGCPAPGVAYSGRLDCNRNPHMNFFAVTLGAKGLQFNPDLATPQDPFTSPYPTWPTSFPARHPSAVDDLWHATINGRGQLLNARSPEEISTKLNSVLNSITSETSTAASAALNSGSVSDGSFVYQARFQSGKWTGQLLSYGLQTTSGDLDRGGDGVADSARVSRLPTTRSIYTLNSAGEGVPFDWTDLSADTVRVQQLAPGTFATEADRATEAQQMLNYLRGADTNEERADPISDPNNATRYRRRINQDGTPNKLGDIVSSAPLYVGAPAFRYRDSFQREEPYSAFVERQTDRTPMVYVGANDGMLHAFYATGTNRGLEAFAYVPGGLFGNLRDLASKTYGHRFYVDGSPGMGDAYFSGAWRTVVAGGLNKGGQMIYALDVTTPGSFSGDSILWEFTDDDDRDLGYTYSQPSIAKLGDGRWYVIFGNGYNSMQNDDLPGATEETSRVSQTGNAVLFLVDLETKDVIKLDTGKGYAQRPTGVRSGNGLATPSVVDLNGDRRVDVVYAGDLYGNMWKFDVSANATNGWNVALGGNPLFVARNDQNEVQPITVRPEISRGPNGNGQVVLFGTGKYLETADKDLSVEVEHSFYGIYDRGSAVTYTTRNGTLLKQEILSEPTVTRTSPTGTTITTKVRVTTNNQNPNASGWYIDLVSPTSRTYQGERQVTNPTVRNGAVIFTTLVPSNDPCNFGGTSWLMEIDALTGSRLSKPPFDLNRDGQFSQPNDTVGTDEDGNPISPSGIGFEEIVQAPAIGDGRYGTEGGGSAVQYKYLPGSSGNIQVVIENPGTGGSGRQSWRQIR